MDAATPQRICLLGATGSIGASTLDVIARHPDRYRLFALSAANRVDELAALCRRFAPRYAAMPDRARAAELRAQLVGTGTEVLDGPGALSELAAHPEVDAVMAAIVGAAGLEPCLAAARAGKRLLLANKEAIVLGGALFIDAADRQRALGDLPVPARGPRELAPAHRPHRAHRLRRPVPQP
jgi:1-deoxy-D-xylulose-5-phosphate reductoisomerase